MNVKIYIDINELIEFILIRNWTSRKYQDGLWEGFEFWRESHPHIQQQGRQTRMDQSVTVSTSNKGMCRGRSVRCEGNEVDSRRLNLCLWNRVQLEKGGCWTWLQRNRGWRSTNRNRNRNTNKNTNIRTGQLQEIQELQRITGRKGDTVLSATEFDPRSKHHLRWLSHFRACTTRGPLH